MKDGHSVKIATLPRYLVGHRDAILEIASSRSATMCSILFVISAALAREYDGEDLLHEPWHLVRPLIASWIAGTCLFVLVHGVAMIRDWRIRSIGDEDGRDELPSKPPSVFHAYRVFMTLFWMMAPMAWLYAIPFERMMTPGDAVAMNLKTLGLVSIWRVVLITRVITVLHGLRFTPVFFLVMLFADALVIGLMSTIPLPILHVMGGIRHTDRNAVIVTAIFFITMMSVFSAPIWIIGAIRSLFSINPTWRGFHSPASGPTRPYLLYLGVLSIIIWIPALWIAQPEQFNRRTATKHLLLGRISNGLQYMSERTAADFPPHWNPPPRVGYEETSPHLSAIQMSMLDQPAAVWVTDVYLWKSKWKFLFEHSHNNSHGQVEEPNWNAVLKEIAYRVDATEFKHEDSTAIDFILRFDKTLTEADRVALHGIRDLIE